MPAAGISASAAAASAVTKEHLIRSIMTALQQCGYRFSRPLQTAAHEGFARGALQRFRLGIRTAGLHLHLLTVHRMRMPFAPTETALHELLARAPGQALRLGLRVARRHLLLLRIGRWSDRRESESGHRGHENDAISGADH